MKAPHACSRRDRRSGVALVTVMCLTFVVAVLVAAVLRLSLVHLRLAREQVNLEQATYAAEAGLELAAYHLSHGVLPPCSFDGHAGQAVYCVVIIDGGTPAAGNHSIGGQVGVNPNNSPSAEFDLALPNGTHIRRDDLTKDFPGYTGPATNVLIRPKGHGWQTGLLLDGKPYPLDNGKTCEIGSQTMTVHLFNDRVNAQGKAIGQWCIALASTAAQVFQY